MGKNSVNNNIKIILLESLDQAKNLSDEELLSYLLNYWNLEGPIICGYIKISRGNDAWRMGIKNLKGEILEYPFYDGNNFDSLMSGAYLGGGYTSQFDGTYVHVNFQINNKEIREKKSNYGQEEMF